MIKRSDASLFFLLAYLYNKAKTEETENNNREIQKYRIKAEFTPHANHKSRYADFLNTLVLY